MLVIRQEQIDAFREYMTRQFENQMLSHVQRYFHYDFQVLGEQNVRKMIRYGIEHSKSYGLVMEDDVSKYIEMMFAFGRNFDTDSAYSWAAQILKDEDLTGAMKMERVYKEVEQHLAEAHSSMSEKHENEAVVK